MIVNSQEQEKLIIVYIDKWLNKVYSCKNQTDKIDASEAIKYIYKNAGYKEPYIWFCDSILMAQLIVIFLKVNKANLKSNLWSNLKSNLRFNLESNLESNLWSNLESNLKSNLESNLWSNLESNLWSNLESNLKSNLESNLWSNLESNLKSNLESNLKSNLESNLWSNLGSNLESNLWSNLEPFSYYGNISDYRWTALYEYINDNLFKEYKNKDWDNWKKLMNSNVYDMIQLDGLVIVVNMPNKIKMDIDNNLHSENDSAVSWRDGYEVYSLCGIILDNELYNKIINKQFSLKELLILENQEHKMLALKYDPEKLIKSPSAELINKNKETELYLIKKIFSTNAWFIKYKDPSTNRIYISGIDPKVAEETRDAEKCRLWKFPLLWDAYNNTKNSDKFYTGLIES